MPDKQEKPLMLMILDGWGLGPKNEHNAIYKARTPNLDHLMKHYPHTIIHAAGEAVGLPPRTMGNSEVGHINIGAGRTVYQSLMRINVAIQDGSFFKNDVLLKTMDHVKTHQSSLHLMGLVSEGPVHSHFDHLLALLKMAKNHGLKKVFVHAFMDGRDTPPDSGKGFMQNLVAFMQREGVGRVGTISGRYWAMDRDKNYDRVKRAYEAMTEGKGTLATDPVEAIAGSYALGPDHYDEFIEPIVMVDRDQKPLGLIQNDDAAVFFNFRPDRAKQMTYAFTQKDFKGFERQSCPQTFFTKMTRYAEDLGDNVVFGPMHLEKTLGEVLADYQLPQLRIAETEKYAHVTHFFNGATDEIFPLEERKLISSPKDVEGKYERKPEMSAFAITDTLLPLLAEDRFKVIILNFANCDMVGHTGVMEAAVQAMEAVDTNVGRIVKSMLEKNGVVIITADHGNAEKMTDTNGKAVTQHSINDVPLILVGHEVQDFKLKEGSLGDIAPTLLDLLEIPKPPQMTGHSMIVK